jgi:hypothetical protein
MKPFLTVVVSLTALAACAQTTAPDSEAMESQIRRGFATRPDQTYFSVKSEKPNEIRRDHVSYSGILVQLAKTDKPLQLINPAAPPEYGSSEDNVVRDPHTGHEGLKLFSIGF